MRRRDGPKPGPVQLQFFGGPKDGETMTAMPGIPELAVSAPDNLDGFYVWRLRHRRYEWREVPPALPTDD